MVTGTNKHGLLFQPGSVLMSVVNFYVLGENTFSSSLCPAFPFSRFKAFPRFLAPLHPFCDVSLKLPPGVNFFQ